MAGSGDARLGMCAVFDNLRLQPGDQRQRAVFGTNQAADGFDHRQRVIEAALVEGIDRHAGLDQVAGDVGLQIGESEYQIRLHGHDLVQVAAGEGIDLGLFLARLRWINGIAGDAGDTVLFAEGVENLDRFGGQADDAFGEAGHGFTWLIDGCVRHRDGRRVSLCRRECAACAAA